MVIEKEFNIVKENGKIISFDKSETNQYQIFDYIESSIRLNDGVFMQNSDFHELNGLLTLPNNPTIDQQAIIKEILKNTNKYSNFTTKGYGQFYYSIRGKEIHFSDFDYPQLSLFPEKKFFTFAFFTIPNKSEEKHLYYPTLVSESSIVEALKDGRLEKEIVGYVVPIEKKFKIWLPSKLSFYQRCIIFNSFLPLEEFIQEVHVYTSNPFKETLLSSDEDLYLQINFQTNPEPTVTLRRQL